MCYVYEMVTDRIIAELEKGNIPWKRPWTGVRSGAYNRITKKPYSIINQILLKYSGEYATFKQWSELGGHIKKGEKSEIVVFWKIYQKEETNEETGEKEVRKIPVLKYYNVFHISQVEGVKPLEVYFCIFSCDPLLFLSAVLCPSPQAIGGFAISLCCLVGWSEAYKIFVFWQSHDGILFIVLCVLLLCCVFSAVCSGSV